MLLWKPRLVNSCGEACAAPFTFCSFCGVGFLSHMSGASRCAAISYAEQDAASVRWGPVH